jgi:hypothetical protein
MEATVKWGSHSFKGNAQGVYLEISSIGKEVNPKQIVEYARNNEDSELHKCFTWDDTKAAEKWRIQEARLITANLVVNYKKEDSQNEKTEIVRAFFRTDSSIHAGYKRTIEIIKDEDEYAGLLMVAKKELKQFKDKYSILSNQAELKQIFALIEEL